MTPLRIAIRACCALGLAGWTWLAPAAEDLPPWWGPASDGLDGPKPTAPAVRVPRHIRVLLENGSVEVVPLELYVRRSLPREWYASWENYPGGSNSLQAGAVAVRTYAIGYVNNPRGPDHDICATTACQVYGSTTAAATDRAVARTTHWVMTTRAGLIPRGLTEYSSENNQFGEWCGDGYTAPFGGCLADPVCAGELPFGHGRGMCQWGSVKWATGLKFPGNSFADTTTLNGFPPQTWTWILGHYYPDLLLVEGAPLEVGQLVKAAAANGLAVRECPGGGITNGANCPLLGTAPNGATGVILAGPELVTADGLSHTWWRIQWSSGLTGWSAENWVQRAAPWPPAPTLAIQGLQGAAPVVVLSWDAVPGLTYRVQSRQTLDPAAWFDISGAITASGARAAFTNVVSGGQRFYRVVSP